MEFTHLEAPQRSPEWYKARLGKPTASRLVDLMARSKRDGKPLKACTDYLLELAFERKFERAFEKFVTGPMQKGILYEDFAKREYELITNHTVTPTGCWHSEVFAASPDGLVGEDGLVEIKIMMDTSFVDLLMNDVPEAHYLQIQGNLWATGRKWCDHVAVNLSTRKACITRVEADEETIGRIQEAVTDIPEMELSVEGVYDISDIPDIEELLLLEGQEIPPQEETIW